MSLGPGRYNDVCTYVRKRTRARLVILMILDGERGEGFEVQTSDPLLLKTLPKLLRDMADGIEGDAQHDIDTLLGKRH